MNDGVRQVRYVMEKLVLRVFSNLMRSCNRESSINAESNLGEQPVSHPTGTDLGHSVHAIDLRDRRRDASNDPGIDRIEQALADTLGRLTADEQDGGGNHQAHHGVGPLGTKSNSNGPDEHQQRGNAVGTGVNTVCFQSSRADTATFPNPILGHHLVAQGADHGGCHHDAEVRDLLRMDESVDCLIPSKCG